MRALRLGAVEKRLIVVSEASTAAVCEMIDAERPVLVIVDSIQTMFVDEISSAPGSVGQVRESTGRFFADS